MATAAWATFPYPITRGPHLPQTLSIFASYLMMLMCCVLCVRDPPSLGCGISHLRSQPVLALPPGSMRGSGGRAAEPYALRPGAHEEPNCHRELGTQHLHV